MEESNLEADVSAIVQESPEQKTVETIADIMTKEVEVVQRETELGDALKVMFEKKFRHLLVCDSLGPDKKLVGVVSDRDILKHMPPLRDAFQTFQSKRMFLQKQVSSVMSEKLITVRPETSLQEAITLIVEKKINCLPVVDDEMSIKGVVTATDLLLVLRDVYKTQSAS